MGEAKRRRRAHKDENWREQSAEWGSAPGEPDTLATREAPQGRTKKQHYNPKLHLKRFTNASGKLHVYDKFTDKTFPAGVDDVGHENHFLTFPELDGDRGAGAHFEGLFGPAEDAAAPVIESILEQVDSGVVSGIVSSDAKRPLARFLALQHLRTKVGRARAIAGRDAMARAMTELEKEGLSLEPHNKELFTGAIDPKTAHAELLLHPTLVDEMTRVLLGHVWYVYTNRTGAPLYTSDHPLSFHCFDSSPLRGAGPASFGAELSYPLSPTCLLTLVEREWAKQNLGKRVWLDGSLLGKLKPTNIEYQRSLQVSGSYRFVYCPLPDFGLAREMCNKDPRLRRPPENQVVLNLPRANSLALRKAGDCSRSPAFEFYGFRAAQETPALCRHLLPGDGTMLSTKAKSFALDFDVESDFDSVERILWLRPMTKMKTQRRSQVSRLVATLWKHRELLSTARSTIGGHVPVSLEECELTDFYTLEVSASTRATSQEDRSIASGLAERLSRRIGSASAQARFRPLILLLLEALAEEVRASLEPKRVSRKPFQPSVIGVLDTATKVTRDVLRAAASEAGDVIGTVESLLSTVNSVHRTAQAHMKEANAAAIQQGTAVAVEKAKGRLVSVVTLPQLVCVGLPRLVERARNAEAAHVAMIAALRQAGHNHPERHEKARQAKDAWYEALEEYVTLAVFTAHPIRLSNLAYGRIGSTPDAEWCLDVEYDSSGTPIRIRSVQGHFAHRLLRPANLIAGLKQHGKEQVWPWWPGIIDHDLLLCYILMTRRERIIARGLLRDATGAPVTAATYSLKSELMRPTLALFIPSHNLKKDPNPLAYNGGFAGHSLLSDIAGRGLHRVARDILGNTHIPEFEECGTGDWAGLFAGHMVRLLWSTYWFGLRSDLQRSPVLTDGTRVSGRYIAEWATTDEERTLKREYTEVSARMTARLMDPVDSWTHPRAYDEWMDRALRREAIDWAAEAVPLPPHLLPLAPVFQPRRSHFRARRKIAGRG